MHIGDSRDSANSLDPIHYFCHRFACKAGHALFRGTGARFLPRGGLTATKVLISKRPELVTKVIRATLRAVQLIKDDKKFGIEFIKGPHLDIGRERERLAERVYEAAVQGYLLSGSVDEKLQQEMIADAAQRIKPAQPVTPERVFDYSFVHKVSQTVR